MWLSLEAGYISELRNDYLLLSLLWPLSLPNPVSPCCRTMIRTTRQWPQPIDKTMMQLTQMTLLETFELTG